MPTKNLQEQIEAALSGQLRVWHIPNPPGTGFRQCVPDVETAKHVLTALAEYDLYLGEDVVAANGQGLEVYKGGEWTDWTDNEGRTIDEVLRAEDEEDE